MLQQTQVDRVVPRYRAWLERWPTVESLAAALAGRRDPRMARAGLQPARSEPPPCRADRRTRGLARRPHLASRRRSVHRGGDPLLRSRRGRAPGGRERRPGAAPNRPRVLGRAAQALMDLGATICLARIPRCEACPLAARSAPRAGFATSRHASKAPFEGSFRQRRAATLRVVAADAARASTLSTTRPSARSSATASSSSRRGSSACPHSSERIRRGAASRRSARRACRCRPRRGASRDRPGRRTRRPTGTRSPSTRASRRPARG